MPSDQRVSPWGREGTKRLWVVYSDTNPARSKMWAGRARAGGVVQALGAGREAEGHLGLVVDEATGFSSRQT